MQDKSKIKYNEYKNKSEIDKIKEEMEKIINSESLDKMGLDFDERLKLAEELIKDKVDEILKKYEKNDYEKDK